jgi:UDP-2,4-diacetamido-2,4,6-trideoxy-beta-L-altropyranose hydrolase
MNRTAIFRFDASITIGGGHAYRCLTLARALADAGWEIIVASRPETFSIVPVAAGFRTIFLDGPADKEADAIHAAAGSADLLVVDHYGRDAVFERTARVWARCIMVIDDFANRPHDCDFLLDQTHGRQAMDYLALVPAHCRLLLGARYALLRPQFAQRRAQALARRQSGKVEHLLIAMGATDPDDLTGRALDGISEAGVAITVDVVLSPAAPHLDAVRRRVERMTGVRTLTGVDDIAELMTAADLAIGAGGTTSWERCCLGLPTLLVVTADNQQLIARNLGESGAANILGWHGDVSAADIGRALTALLETGQAMRFMADSAARVCDGQGVQRTLNEVTV